MEWYRVLFQNKMKLIEWTKAFDMDTFEYLLDQRRYMEGRLKVKIVDKEGYEAMQKLVIETKGDLIMEEVRYKLQKNYFLIKQNNFWK